MSAFFKIKWSKQTKFESTESLKDTPLDYMFELLLIILFLYFINTLVRRARCLLFHKWHDVKIVWGPFCLYAGIIKKIMAFMREDMIVIKVMKRKDSKIRQPPKNWPRFKTSVCRVLKQYLGYFDKKIHRFSEWFKMFK